MKSYAIAIGVRAAILVGFYFWLEGSVGAGRLTQFALWIMSLCLILAAGIQIEKPTPYKKRPFLWKATTRCYSLTVLCLLIWLACPVLATAWLLGVICISVARTEPVPGRT